MRRVFINLLGIIAFIMLTANIAFASAVYVVVNGDALEFPDVAPYIREDGETMVPVRLVSERLGAKVGWEEAEQKVVLDYKDKKIFIPVNEKVAFIDSSPIDLYNAAVIKDGRTLVPLRFVSEVLGARVLWNEHTSTIRISTGAIDMAAISARNNRYSDPPRMVIDNAKQYTAAVKTNRGSFKIRLLAAEAPLAVNNFVFLAKNGFYNGIPFHRIIEGFIIQTGDPLGNGAGGPGYRFKDELPPRLPYEEGIVAMDNSRPNTNGSQFFICSGEKARILNRLPHYTVFGRVVEGMDTILKISSTPVVINQMGEYSAPMETIFIETIEVEE